MSDDRKPFAIALAIWDKGRWSQNVFHHQLDIGLLSLPRAALAAAIVALLKPDFATPKTCGMCDAPPCHVGGGVCSSVPTEGSIGIIRFACVVACANGPCVEMLQFLSDTAQEHLKKTHPVIKRCAHCHRWDVKLRKCSDCERVYYCSMDCQRADRLQHAPTCLLVIAPPPRFRMVEYTVYFWDNHRSGFVACPTVRRAILTSDARLAVIAQRLAKDIKPDLDFCPCCEFDWPATHCYCGAKPLTDANAVVHYNFQLLAADDDALVTHATLFHGYVCKTRRCRNAFHAVVVRINAEAAGTGRLVRVCAKCRFVPKVTLPVCSTCRAVYYCSSACQKADWTEHKKTHVFNTDSPTPSE